jgi:uncharacterized membrane protein YedE/YeeE
LHLLPTRYDGNILGGALLGAGMAVSGACPGTVLAQLGVGVKSGRWALGGAVLAGVVWSFIVRNKGECSSASASCSAAAAAAASTKDGDVVGVKGYGTVDGDGVKVVDGVDGGEQKKETEKGGDAGTVYGALGIGRGGMLVGLEAVLVLVIAAAVKFTNAAAGEARGIPPYFAGLAIAAAQLVSMVLRGSLLGASSAFEELGSWVWGGRKYANVLFSAGLVGGAWLMSSAVPSLRPVTEIAISPVRSALGGFMIVFGSRMAGGCTSGHGISGLSLMSISSFLTAAAIFGAGGLTGLLMG